MTKIKAVGFDYGGVIGGDPSLGLYFTEQNAELLSISSEEWRSTYFNMNSLLNTGAISNKVDFWTKFLENFNQVDKLDKVLALDAELSDKYIAVNSSMLALVDRLHNADYKVGLLSNATAEVAGKIKQLGIAHHFDSFLFSIDIGLQKPDCLAFTKLAASLSVGISELVFIDDAKKSLVNAAECGFTPILFKSQTQLESDLHKLGLTY
jgi:HAD superfamily hydrolase (TIGR01509 family)